VALTRSPVMKPKVLMANEPTGDLDSRKAESGWRIGAVKSPSH
jgi:ABC-type ATPase involved in cell division